MAKVDYKSLPDTTGSNDALTVKQIAEEFSIPGPLVVRALETCKLEPVGKTSILNPDGTKARGKPRLTYSAADVRQKLNALLATP